MDYIEKLLGIKVETKNNILITTKDVKDELLKYRFNHKIIDNLKIMTEQEYITSFIFEENIEILIYLINNNPFNTSKLNVDVARQIYKALFIIYNLQITNHHLYQLAIELSHKFNLKANTNNINYDAYLYLPRVDDLLLLQHDYKYQPATCKAVNVKEYNYFLSEIEASIEYISELLTADVAIDDIIIYAPNEYNEILKQTLRIYNIPVETENSYNLINHKDSIKCLNDFFKYKSIDFENVDPTLKEPIATIFNKYVTYDIEQCRTLILADFENAKIRIEKRSGIKIKNNIDSLFTCDTLKNKHFVLLGNYQNGLVKYGQNINIIEDEYRKKLPNTNMKNLNEDVLLYKIIANGSNVWLSTSQRVYEKNVLRASNLKNAIYINESCSESNYSYNMNKLKFARAKHTLDIYKSKTADYKALVKYFKLEKKDNKYTTVNNDITNLKLSFTSINNYFKCSYRFYLEHILRVKNANSKNNKMLVGNLTHYILERVSNISTSEDIAKYTQEFIKINNLELNKIEKIYIDKLQDFLYQYCQIQNEEESLIGYEIIEREKRMEITLNDNISLIGTVDKLYSKIVDNNLYVEIYDYKSGKLSIDINMIEHGLNMQNIIYFILLKNELKNEQGQEILNGTFQQQVKSKLMYEDETLLDTFKIEGFSQEKDELIIKRKIKTLNEEELDEVVLKVERKIDDIIQSIKTNDFKINPKVIKNKNVSCPFCPYSSVCNKTNEDIVYL